jgi:glutaconate CoA-transferase subunit A
MVNHAGEKLTDLKTAIADIPDGAMIGIGGNTLNRAPMAAAAELARQGKRGLALVKTAGAMDIDLLCLAGCVDSVDAGFVGYESLYGLARHYRACVEAGKVKTNEHACYTVISALRAAVAGVGFMPVAGLVSGGLPRVNPRFRRVRDPFTGEDVTVVSALRPDYALIHVHRADAFGNAAIDGPLYEDILLAKASRRVILTAEEIVDTSRFRDAGPADIPGFLVSRVVHAPRGAAPCACHGLYGPDDGSVRAFLSLTDEDGLWAWLGEMERRRELPERAFAGEGIRRV